jgi:hypothetical protein
MNARRNKNRDRAIRTAIVQLFALQIRLGASIEEVHAIARTSIRLASGDAISEGTNSENKDAHQYASVLRMWHRDTRFLSNEGFPKHLGVSGRNSLRTLIASHYPRRQYEMVIQALAQAELIKRDKKGRWYPTGKHAVYPSLSDELLAHLSEGVARFIDTMTRNVEIQEKGELLFERSCKVRRLPVSAGPDFREFVNGQALAFLESVDDWLENRVEEGKVSGAKTCTAGVFAFAFMDELTKRQRQFRNI